MSIKIRSATLDDLDALYNIEKECFGEEAFTREHLIYLMEKPNAICLRAITNSKIAGFIIGLIETRSRARVGHIYTVNVVIEHRRSGIGMKLLEELERIFLNRKAKMIYLEVRADNIAAIELYRKNGYTEVQPLKDYYSIGAHGYQMKKNLRNDVYSSRCHTNFRKPSIIGAPTKKDTKTTKMSSI